jgi:2-C-methyl-D-erythritol 2,4-cyclodiphosphate synthase
VRIGFGYDVHRLAPGRPMILGGVTIPHETGPDGHSDADVLLHAVCDALLGAAALGDIGALFPNTDDAWRGADSRGLLREVVARVTGAGYRVGNVDAMVALERPKLRPHVDTMRANLAADLGVDVAAVSVKAGTNERMGFVGREEGLAAYAVCLLLPRG